MKFLNLTSFPVVIIIYDSDLEKQVFKEELEVGQQLDISFEYFDDQAPEIISSDAVITFHEDKDHGNALQVKKNQPCETTIGAYSCIIHHPDDSISV